MSALRKFIPRIRRAPTSREILLALIEHGDVELVREDGSARIAFDAPAEVVDQLMCWDDSAREDEEIDYERDARELVAGGGSAA